MDTDWRAEEDEESPGNERTEGMGDHDFTREEITSEDDFARGDDESTSGDELVQAQGAGEAESGSELTAANSDTAADHKFVAPLTHTLFDVLLPANPPKPQNARIIRRFDLEAARFDPRPAAAPATPEKKPETLSREEARALRNRSLRAAARLE